MSSPPEHARAEVQVRICGDTLDVFKDSRRIKTFHTTLGATKVITFDHSLDPNAPGFGNTVKQTIGPLRGFSPIPMNPLCRDIQSYVSAMRK